MVLDPVPRALLCDTATGIPRQDVSSRDDGRRLASPALAARDLAAIRSCVIAGSWVKVPSLSCLLSATLEPGPDRGQGWKRCGRVMHWPGGSDLVAVAISRGCDRRSLDSDRDDRPILNAASTSPRTRARRMRRRHSGPRGPGSRALATRDEVRRLLIGSLQERSLMGRSGKQHSGTPGTVPQGASGRGECDGRRMLGRRRSSFARPAMEPRRVAPGSGRSGCSSSWPCFAGGSARNPEPAVPGPAGRPASRGDGHGGPDRRERHDPHREDQGQDPEPVRAAARPAEGRGRPQEPDGHQVVLRRRSLLRGVAPQERQVHPDLPGPRDARPQAGRVPGPEGDPLRRRSRRTPASRSATAPTPPRPGWPSARSSGCTRKKATTWPR